VSDYYFTYLHPTVFFQFNLEDRWRMNKCKLGVISQERLKIEVKLLLLIGSHVYRVDWHKTDDLE